MQYKYCNINNLHRLRLAPILEGGAIHCFIERRSGSTLPPSLLSVRKIAAANYLNY